MIGDVASAAASRSTATAGRARLPGRVGHRDGRRRRAARVRRLRERATPTIVLLPSTPIIHSRQWKAQIHYLSRHYRVVAYDGRGNGRSDRPTDPAAYVDDRLVDDIEAVMDATGTTARGPRRAVRRRRLARRSGSPPRSPDRVAGHRRVRRRRAPARRRRTRGASSGRSTTSCRPTRAGPSSTAHYWRRDYAGLRPVLLRRRSPPSRTRPRRSRTPSSWALDGSVDAMLAEARRADFDLDLDGRRGRSAARSAARCSSSTGRRTAASRSARAHRLAELTGAPLVVVEGADHMIPGRHPVLANLLIREFVESLPEVRA